IGVYKITQTGFGLLLAGGENMNVHFIDTSVFAVLLQIPGFNEERREELFKELKRITADREVLILPFATIIESGNHIAHIAEGHQRRETARRFVDCIEKTVDGEAPWTYYGEQMTPEELRIMCKDFVSYAQRKEGFGDLSIVRAYERYKEDTPAVSRIRIWSLDKHLM
ncbi:MAG: hypothetical protein LUF30_01905, partial [Lachnospiraceae bacterium]|nr:hypothetical protein [Lachnospiraceae bacterium]